MTARLHAHGIRKAYPGVVALDGVDLSLEPGEVHVLLGENGAGKSTLIKVLAGAVPPDAGAVELDGRPVRLTDAATARRLGIATIHQELSLVPPLTVAENLLLGRTPRRFGLVDRARVRAQAQALLTRVGARVDGDAVTGTLGLAGQQMVEIAKALGQDVRVLVMDEPTAALSYQERNRLFDLVRELAAGGVSVLFVSHHLEEVAEIGDRVTVLRDGRKVAETAADVGRPALVRHMVGREVDTRYPSRPASAPGTDTASVSTSTAGAPLLRVRGLTRRGAFTDVSFEVRAGEVVGLAGLVGAGRTELVRALFGADRPDAGSLEVDGRSLRPGDVRAARAAGLGLVPEDRKASGLVLGMSVAENLALATLRSSTRAGIVDDDAVHEQARRMSDRLRIRTPSMDTPVRALSGGNQQKVVIGRWLLAEARLLILDEPTRGIDVGAKAEIYDLVNAVTRAGAAVLMVSSDLPEVLAMSDRVLVMAAGRITGQLPAHEATQDAVMDLATRGKESAVV